MTSMPASRRARATIFAPRSWPSRPGLATRTRILSSMNLITGFRPVPLPKYCRQIKRETSEYFRLFQPLRLVSDKVPTVGAENLHFTGLGVEHPHYLGPGGEILLDLLRQFFGEVGGRNNL